MMEMTREDSVTYKSPLVNASLRVGGELCPHRHRCFGPQPRRVGNHGPFCSLCHLLSQQPLNYIKITTTKEKGKSQTRK